MWKEYGSKGSAANAVVRKGFKYLKHEIVKDKPGVYRPVFTVGLLEDKRYVEGKGFQCKLDAALKEAEDGQAL